MEPSQPSVSLGNSTEMKITIEFEIEVDGECPNPHEIFAQWMNENFVGGIGSEDIDGTNNYFLLVRGWEILNEGE